MSKQFSLRVEPASQVLDWMSAYQNEPKLTFKDGANDVALHGVSFDVEDIACLIKNLDDSKHKVFLGLAKRPDGSHTIVIGGIELIKNAAGEVVESKFIHNVDSQPIYDFAKPCPIICPKTIVEV